VLPVASNPYESPVEVEHHQAVPVYSPLVLGMLGLSMGGLCGAVGAFVGGGLAGFTYRLFHDVVYGGAGIFGLFGRTATPMDFALFHGTLAVLPLALGGGVLGCIQGFRAARRQLGVLGIACFAFGGLLVGVLNGGAATNTPSNFVSHFIEGPLAGGIYGATTAAIAWCVFRNRINAIALRSKNCQVNALLVALLVIFGSLLILFGTTLGLGSGTEALQVVMQFAAIMLLAIICGIVWLLRKRGVFRLS